MNPLLADKGIERDRENKENRDNKENLTNKLSENLIVSLLIFNFVY